MSSPPQVFISTTTGSVEADCCAAATAASCPGLTQVFALASGLQNIEAAAKKTTTIAYNIFLIVGSPC